MSVKTMFAEVGGHRDSVDIGRVSMNYRKAKTMADPRASESGATRMTKLLQTIVTSSSFRAFVASTIFLNVVQMGMAVQLKTDPWTHVFNAADHFFTATFTIELLLRLGAWKSSYFSTKLDVVDFILAIFGVVDTWVVPLLFGVSENSWDVLDMLRLIRLLRIIRVLTIHRQLLVVVEGITCSLSSMVWVGVLLGIIIYGAAIFCVLMFKNTVSLQMYFDNLWNAMLTLYNMVLLDEWSVVVRPVAKEKPFLVPLFVVFVVFTSCGVMNVIVGIIVEGTTEASIRYEKQNHQLRVRVKMQKVDELWGIMNQLDQNGDGQLSEAEVLAAIFNEKFSELFSEFDLPKGFRIDDLFAVLDCNANGMLTGEEFVDGMFRMVNNDSFQHTCMFQLGMSQIKKLVKETHEAAISTMAEGFERVLEELRSSQLTGETNMFNRVIHEIRSSQLDRGQNNAIERSMTEDSPMALMSDQSLNVWSPQKTCDIDQALMESELLMGKEVAPNWLEPQQLSIPGRDLQFGHPSVGRRPSIEDQTHSELCFAKLQKSWRCCKPDDVVCPDDQSSSQQIEVSRFRALDPPQSMLVRRSELKVASTSREKGTIHISNRGGTSHQEVGKYPLPDDDGLRIDTL